jgi:hypothetical protein
MTNSSDTHLLPSNPTTKDINIYKKKINWGEIPAFFHLISNAVAESEGFISHGFDNAYKKIVDRSNWNYHHLGIEPSVDIDKLKNIELIQPLRKPRICIYHVFNTQGYELIALPYVKDKLIDEYRSGDPEMDFTIWDPSQMKVLVRIPQMHKFISFNNKNGDKADMALIIHAYNVVNSMINRLKQEVDVHAVEGMSVKDIYKVQRSNPNLAPNDVIKTQIVDSDL